MTREALTILEGLHESIMQLRIKNYGIERELYDIDAQVSRAIDHLTALSEPFDITKVEGWRRMGTYDIGGYLTSGWERGNFQLHKSSELPWYDLTMLGTRMFRGEIKTQAFFTALCEGLNIKQQ